MFVVILSNAEFEVVSWWAAASYASLRYSIICLLWYQVMLSLRVSTFHGIGIVLPHYSSQIKSIPWLLMTWVLVSPGHQQTWFRLYGVNKSLLSTKKDYLLLPSVEKWLKLLIYFYLPLTEFTKTRVKAFSQGKSQRMNMCDICHQCVLPIWGCSHIPLFLWSLSIWSSMWHSDVISHQISYIVMVNTWGKFILGGITSGLILRNEMKCCIVCLFSTKFH